jgi:hypothetical protein
VWISITSNPASTAHLAASAQVRTIALHSSAVSWCGVSHPFAAGSLVGPTGCHTLAPTLISCGVSGLRSGSIPLHRLASDSLHHLGVTEFCNKICQ